LKRAQGYIQFSEDVEKLRNELLTIRKLRAVLADAQGFMSVG
jgi:hypothetical protein